MKKRSKDCSTFEEFRKDVLQLRQADLAHACKCKQAWISKIENGHIPQPWNLETIQSGLEKLGHNLSIDELKRLIVGSQTPLLNQAPYNAVKSVNVSQTITGQPTFYIATVTNGTILQAAMPDMSRVEEIIERACVRARENV